MPSIAAALEFGRHTLSDQYDTARLDAEVLLAHVLDKPRTYLLTWDERAITDENWLKYQSLIESRYAGQPIAYLTGQREFWSLVLQVTPDTLIPRPETEMLVEAALSIGHKREALTVFDLGTGSGAIALAIASEQPAWNIVATDISDAAIEVARSNAKRLQITNVQFCVSDWFENFSSTDKADLILSNPPYVAESDDNLKKGDVRFEPALALQAGPDGLAEYSRFVKEAKHFLRPGGWLLVEHGFDQAQALRQLFENAGFSNVQQDYDLALHPRMTRGQLKD